MSLSVKFNLTQNITGAKMWFFHIYVCIWVCPLVQSEVFSALAGMEALVETEGFLMKSLETYIKNQEIRLQHLKREYVNYEPEYNRAKNGISSYLGNPVNAFKIIKRLHHDWRLTEFFIANPKPEDMFPNITDLKNTYLFPEANDLSGSSDALIRLQNLYRLKNTDVAEGRIKGVQYSLPMTASDAFEYGVQLCDMERYINATSWFRIALTKVGKDYDPNLKKQILEWMTHSSYQEGDIYTALNCTQEILIMDPDHSRALENFASFIPLLEKIKLGESLINYDNPNEPYFFDYYKELCRDELDLPEKVKKSFKCRYMTNNNPFLKIAPIKTEEYYLDPYIAVFHDVIYDKEIKFIQETAQPRLARSSVIDFRTSIRSKAKIRVSKNCFLDDEEGEVLQKINQRISDITKLSVEFGEAIQVANYGTGGHYEPHLDFSRKDESKGFSFDNDPDGNRIATFIYYLSDVEQGGRTVFPELGIGVTPRKGSALFWLNLHPSGEGNFATLHGACPVLQGTKWIANKWLHQRGQELKLPCNLEYQDEGLIKVYPRPIFKSNHSQSIRI